MESRIDGIPSDDPQLKKRTENEIIASVEASVIIHRIFMQRSLDEGAQLVLRPEAREGDSPERRRILSLSAGKEFGTTKGLMRCFDNWIE